jgi:ribosomal protein L37E
MSPCPVCGTQVDTKNHKDCSNCGFPVILSSISYTSWQKIASGESELLPQELLVWGNKLYKEYLQLKQQSGKSNQGFNRHHSSLPDDDVINQLADNSQKQDEDEIQRSQSQIKELENQLSLVQSQSKQLLQEFSKLESDLRELNVAIEPKSQHLFSKFTHNLSKRISELQREHIQPNLTPTTAHRQSSSGNELQSQSQIEKLEQTILLIPSQVANLIEGKISTQPAFQNHDLVESQLEQINDNLTRLFTEIKEIKTNINSNSNTPPPERMTGYKVNQNYEIQLQDIPQQTPENEPDAFSDIPWLKTYNQDPESLSKHTTEVSVTEENINQRRLGTNQPVILEKSRRGKGNYWILPKSNTEFYLVPKGYLKINQYNIATVQTLFECIQEQEGNYNSKFILLQPAIVSPVEQEKWQLTKLGVLKF